MTQGWKSTFVAAAAAACLVGSAREAAANCAAGDSYQTFAEGSSVQICPLPNGDANDGRLCPDPLGTGMLRENVDTGEVVLLAEHCASDGIVLIGDAFAFLDPTVGNDADDTADVRTRARGVQRVQSR